MTSHPVVLKIFQVAALWDQWQSGASPKVFRKRSREHSREAESLLETLFHEFFETQSDVLSESNVESATKVIVSASSDWTVAMCPESKEKSKL